MAEEDADTVELLRLIALRLTEVSFNLYALLKILADVLQVEEWEELPQATEPKKYVS